ncbi:fasciclin domain-containing protein [Niastella caeni]|uniref:Fasciclin domain-containing protein n=1 Tax=Niastella caeni TaxID=2569763 RepID=A0A4S8HL78_9BACT|nr:fasciclin domain-containing protein [Niastella caeni]THU36060.1 fasciclin domain-containing protein [Niastella caeni]
MYSKYKQRRTQNAQRLTRKLKINVFRVRPSAFGIWHLIILLFAGSFSITACKKWEDHNKVNNQDLTINLLQALATDENLSTFSGFITKTGLDTVLQSSKNYTVWAPSNSALQNLDPAIVNDLTQLTAFVKNHIASQAYFTRSAATGTRIPVLSGKYNSFEKSKFDDATITTADRFVSNGVLHVIDKPVPVLQNIWEYINSTTGTYEQNAFVVAQNYMTFDPSQAIIDSINVVTGDPIYRPGTGIVYRNNFNDRVYDVKQEDKVFTYFILTNNSFTAESDSLKPYYKSASATYTDTLSKFNTVKDLAVEGLYPANALPAFVLSKNGTPIPLSASAIVATKKLSNGIAYVMNNVDVLTADKFKQVTIEGERPNGFQSDKSGNTNYRTRYDTINKRYYWDLMVTGHGVTAYYAYYSLGQYPSMKYRVYALGVNDFQGTTFNQSVVVKAVTGPTSTTLATLTHAVPLSTAAGAFNEKLLGEFTSTSYGTLEIQLTASGTNPLVLDYLRIVPVP